MVSAADGLVPQDRLQAGFRLPMKLDEMPFALGIDEAEGMRCKKPSGAAIQLIPFLSLTGC